MESSLHTLRSEHAEETDSLKVKVAELQKRNEELEAENKNMAHLVDEEKRYNVALKQINLHSLCNL